MSYTELYAFGTDGSARFIGETKNSHRGAPAIWTYMEKKFFPPFVPSYVQDLRARGFDHTNMNLAALQPDAFHSRFFGSSADEHDINEFWALVEDERLTMNERIVLATTYDNVVLMRKDFQKVIDAFRSFEATTSLPEQADIIEQALADESIIAIAWNQTSLGSSPWEEYVEKEYDEDDNEDQDDEDDDDDPVPYNIFTGTKHIVLWDSPKNDDEAIS